MRIKNGLVVGVILLFIGVAVQPSIAIVQPEEEIKGNLKKYLLKRIRDFSTHPEIKSLSERYKTLGIMESLNASNKENYNGINNTLLRLFFLILYIFSLVMVILFGGILLVLVFTSLILTEPFYLLLIIISLPWFFNSGS